MITKLNNDLYSCRVKYWRGNIQFMIDEEGATRKEARKKAARELNKRLKRP